MSRPTSQSSSATATTTSAHGHTRSLSVKTNTKTSHSNPLPPSDTKLFVTNLRLLDFDLRRDWPNITAQTLSSKVGDQKQRIGGVEWALFRLFEIWDPEETSQKLQPFFPPLEPLQSLNLRAALYRCLNELKKQGILSREAVLRKTMLDECKGEKFFEILAIFSTAVLKKVLAAQTTDGSTVSVARQYSTAGALTGKAQASLLPLAIAHKTALTNLLKKKDEKRRRYSEFENLLNDKKKNIYGRIKQSKATPRSQRPLIPDHEAAAIKKQLSDNWIGDRKWLDAMLYGDDANAEDAFLNRNFDSVWRMVEVGRKPEEAIPEAGLLENLQIRVQEQQVRLQKWQQYHEKLRTDELKLAAAQKKARAQVKEYKFDDHLKLQIKTGKEAGEEPFAKPILRPEYANIISNMNIALGRVGKVKQEQPSAPRLQRRGSSFVTSRSPTRHRQQVADHGPRDTLAKPSSPVRKKSRERFPVRPQQREPANTPIDSDTTLIGQASTVLRGAPVLPRPDQSAPQHHRRESPLINDHDDDTQVETSDPLPAVTSPTPRIEEPPPSPPRQQRSPSPTPAPTPYFPSEPPILEPQPELQTTEEAEAEQIISSIGNATPSPIKKPQPRLSLVERTRMSMARTSNFHNPIDEEEDYMASPELPTLPTPAPPIEENDQPFNRRTSLLDRTRLSMAAMSAQPRPAIDKKKKRESRTSLFPVNQFDTPRNRRSFAAIEEQKSGGSTPKEELFSDDVDYDRIFKSRPRVAHSPIFSPDERTRNVGGAGGGEEDGDVSGLGIGGVDDGFDDDFDEGVTGVDLGDVDRDSDEDGFTQAWENSPLRRAGGGGARRQGKLFG